MPNENFYVVSATVIPVFFLALTLQGKQFDAVEALMRKLNDLGKKKLDETKFELDDEGFSFSPRSFLKFVSIQFLWITIWTVTISVVIFSVLGEVFALLALDQGRADSSTHQVVLIAVLGLTIGVGLLLYIRVQILWGTNMIPMVRVNLRFMRLSILLTLNSMKALRPSQARRNSNSDDEASEQSQHSPEP